MDYNWDSIKNLASNLKDLSTIGSANVLVAVLSGIFWFFMAKVLGTAQFGQINYLVAIASLVSVISSFGARNTVMVYTAKENKVQSTIFFFPLIPIIISSIILFFVFHSVGASLLVVGTIIFCLAANDLLGHKQYKTYSKYLLIQRLLMAGLGIGLYYLLGLQGVILGYAISYFPFIGMVVKALYQNKIDLSIIRSRLGFMTNSYGLELSGALVGVADKLVILPLFGFALLGNYQLGFQFLMILSILPNSVYQFILPRDVAKNPSHKIKKATIIISVVFAILSILLAPLVIPAVLPKYKEAVEIVQIMSLTIIPLSISVVYNSQFFGMEKSRFVLIGSVLYVGVQVIGIVLLGKTFGINGAAMGTVLGATAQAAFLFYSSKTVKTE